jgi:S1-C subfamily serine protease
VRGRLVPSLPMSGDDLNPDEKKTLGLPETQNVFRAARLKDRAKSAGFRNGDVIVAVNDKPVDMAASEFRQYVRREFLVGDTIRLTVIRDGETLTVPLTLNPP